MNLGHLLVLLAHSVLIAAMRQCVLGFMVYSYFYPADQQNQCREKVFPAVVLSHTLNLNMCKTTMAIFAHLFF